MKTAREKGESVNQPLRFRCTAATFVSALAILYGAWSRVPQGQALAVVQIDVPKAASATAAVEALRKVEAIASVRLIELGKL